MAGFHQQTYFHVIEKRADDKEVLKIHHGCGCQMEGAWPPIFDSTAQASFYASSSLPEAAGHCPPSSSNSCHTSGPVEGFLWLHTCPPLVLLAYEA